MPSACSEGRFRFPNVVSLRSCLVRVLLGVALTVSIPWSAEARGASRWSRGVFPVASFQGFTSPYGMRSHPIHGGIRPHRGLDIAAPHGSVVRSWWGGTVREVISDGGCGHGLVIQSGPYRHIYCHLQGRVSRGVYRSGRLALAVGRRVRTGESIGHVGMTGSTTGPHLHWGLQYRGEWMDPVLVLRAMASSRRAR